MLANNLEELIRARHGAGHTHVNSDIKNICNIRVADDEVTYTVVYGEGYWYRDDFTVGHTELLLWYINERTSPDYSGVQLC
ncbi:hypothetical protein VpaJT1_90 [Vibrio phage VpaJT_1]|nr:hypothetical protein VpaJT1_90 [Vibrio phage VpaJT_1]